MHLNAHSYQNLCKCLETEYQESKMMSIPPLMYIKDTYLPFYRLLDISDYVPFYEEKPETNVENIYESCKHFFFSS